MAKRIKKKTASTSNSIFHLIRCLVLASSFIFLSSTAWPHTWQLEKKLLDSLPNFSPELYPETIQSATQLEKLLVELGRNHPLTDLKATFVNKQWIIKANRSRVITHIGFDSIYRHTIDRLQKFLSSYIGHVDTTKSRDFLVQRVQQKLKSMGYPRALVTATYETSQTETKVTYNIKLGPPCIVRSAVFSSQLPAEVELPFAQKTLCDIGLIHEKVDILRDQLTKLGYFDSRLSIEALTYSPDDSGIDVKIAGPIGKKTSYQIVDTQGGSTLLANLFTDSFDPETIETSNVEAAREEIINYYKVRGFDDVRVDGPDSTEYANSRSHQFYLTLGPEYQINEFIILGNKALDTSEINDMIGFSLWRSTIPLNISRINELRQNILAEYEKRGYWDTKVSDPNIKKNKQNEQASLRLTINEGKKIEVQSVEFSGVSTEQSKQLEKHFAGYFQNDLSRNSVIQLEKATANYFMTLGYGEVKTNIKSIDRRGKNSIQKHLKIHIIQGPRYIIDHITIDGLVRTKKVVVERELLLRPGEWLNPSKIIESRNRLLQLGVFRNVQITRHVSKWDTQTGTHRVGIKVRVKEGRAGGISFGPGFDLRRGMRYGAEITHKNLGGWGRQASLRTSISEERHQIAISEEDDRHGKTLIGRKFSLGFVEPHLMGSRLTGSISLSHEAEADQTWDFTNSVEVKITKPLSEINTNSFVESYYRFNQSNSIGSSVQRRNLIAAGDSRIGSIGIRSTIDKRSNLFWPRSGYRLRMEIELANSLLLGEFNYFKWDFGYTLYSEITPNFVLTAGINLTAYENVNHVSDTETILPPTSRLRGRGVSRIRGFERELGPIIIQDDDFSPVLGTRRTLGKLELRYRFLENFATSLFLDSGNTFLSDTDIVRFNQALQASSQSDATIKDNHSYDFSDLITHPQYFWTKHYLAYGASLNYLTPLGPLRIAIALPMHEPESETCQNDGPCFSRMHSSPYWPKRLQIYINIGTEF